MTRRWVAAGVAATALAVAVAGGGAGSRAEACTTAVVSGAATADGRPLLWKNRDAENKENQLIYNTDGRYPFVGVVNRGDAAGFEVWAGLNAAGFAIMNSASYNLDSGDSTAEGQLMRIALQSCATVAEFEALLARSNTGGRDTTANFGVIDARGGAAFFETGRTKFLRFDATDQAAAPRGFIVRSNYSDSGDAGSGSGLIRRQRATSLLERLVAARSLAVATLLAGPAKDLANEHVGSFPEAPGAPRFAYTGDTICRYDTASVALFAGAKPGEDPLTATAWVILGQPVTGAAIPVWVRAAAVPAEAASGAKAAPLTVAHDAIRSLLYPETRGEMKKYLAAEALRGVAKPVLAEVQRVEAANVRDADAALARWRAAQPPAAEVAALQNAIAARTLAALAAVAPKPPAT